MQLCTHMCIKLIGVDSRWESSVTFNKLLIVKVAVV